MRLRKTVRWMAGVCLAVGLMLILLTRPAMAAEVAIDGTNFPDEVFREWISEWDTDGSGSFSDSELRRVKTLEADYKTFQSIKGIEFFTELDELVIYEGNLYGKVDLSKNTKLVTLDLESNYGITSVDVSGCPLLEELNVANASMKKIDVSKNPKLKYLDFSGTLITKIDLSKNANLRELICKYADLKTLDLTKQTKLTYLDCSSNHLSSLNLTKNTALVYANCSANALTALTLGTSYPKMEDFNCSRNLLGSLDVSMMDLTTLTVHGNLMSYATLKMNLNTALGQVWNSMRNTESKEYVEVHDYTYGTHFRGYVGTNGNGRKISVDWLVPVGADAIIRYYTGSSYTSARVPAGTPYTVERVSCDINNRYLLGWALAPGCTEPQYKAGDTITVYRDTILYPVTTYKTFKVKFDLNGGTSGAPATITGTPINTYAEIPTSSPVREGYYFMGWTIRKNDTSAVLKSGDAVCRNNVGDIVLYALWKPRTNKITFDRNGGSGNAPRPISVLSGKTATIPSCSVSREGHYFLGWATTRSATAAEYRSTNTISVTKDTVLYAVWKKMNVSLTFDSNGSSCNPPAKITVPYGTEVTVPRATTMSRNGYWFLGWATSKTATSAAYKSGDKITLKANTTLYAVWKKK